MTNQHEIFLTTLVIILCALLVLFLFKRFTKRRYKVDPVKGSNTQNIFILVTQLVNQDYLEEATFFETFGFYLNNKYPNLNQALVSKHMNQLFKCATDHDFAMRLLWSNTWKLDNLTKAKLVAKAINMANHLDKSKYFLNGLRNHNPAVAHIYQGILKTLNISSEEVKQALEQLHQDSQANTKSP